MQTSGSSNTQSPAADREELSAGAGGPHPADRWLRRFGRMPHRPPWWPADEEWPPRSRRPWRHVRQHNPFFRRLGCLFLISNLLGVLLVLGLLGFVLKAVGVSVRGLDQFAPVLPGGGILIAFGVLLVLVSTMNLRRVSEPLDELLEASERIAAGDYSVRVAANGPSEVRSMADAFNAMASRLQMQDEQRRQWLADVSHELRTPLTILQGNLEGLVDDIYVADKKRLGSLLHEVQVLSRLTDDLRVLALAQDGNLKLRLESTDLGMIIREIVSAAQAQADANAVRLELSIEAGLPPLEVDAERIKQVLNNLLFNALRYTPSGKAVSITLVKRTDRGRAWIAVSVQDQGRGIAPEDLPHVFDRYYKGVDSRGMGLGLAIAKHIVEAHGGEISVSSSASGGTAVSFSLPA